MGISYIALSAGAASSRIWFTGSLIRLGSVRFDDCFICSAFTPTLPVKFDFTSFAFGISSLMFDSFTFLLTFTGSTITPSSFSASFSSVDLPERPGYLRH